MSTKEVLSSRTLERAGLISAGLALGAAATRAYMKSALNDRGFRAYSTTSDEALGAVLEVCTRNGLEPHRRIEDKNVLRALMSDNITVINAPRQEANDQLDNPAGAIMLKVKNPGEAALDAQEVLTARGFEAEIVGEQLAEETKGEMTFVKTNALAGNLIGFRQHVTKMGSMPPRWDK